MVCAAPVSTKKRACKKKKGSAFPALDFRAAMGGYATIGSANAARVSRGTEEDVWLGLSAKDPKRNPHEPLTITVVIYNTVADGVPSEADVVAAVDDLEQLYAACNADGRLV